MTVGSLGDLQFFNCLNFSCFQLLKLSQSLFKLSLIGVGLFLLLALNLFIEFVESRILLLSYQSINFLLFDNLYLLILLLFISLLIESCLL